MEKRGTVFIHEVICWVRAHRACSMSYLRDVSQMGEFRET